jgi:hypothetical protein
MRFLLDHDVDAAVGLMLRRHGHDAWTAGEAGLGRARDDELTVWAAARQAAVVSTGEEFGQRRMRHPMGWHIWLSGPDWEAASLLEEHLDQATAPQKTHTDMTVRVSPGGLSRSG